MASRPHIIGRKFQSDKYPETPRGCVLFKLSDKRAQDLLWKYAMRMEDVDWQFSDDLRFALLLEGYHPGDKGLSNPQEADFDTS